MNKTMKANADLVINDLSVQVANLTREKAVLNALVIELSQELETYKKSEEVTGEPEDTTQNVVE